MQANTTSQPCVARDETPTARPGQLCPSRLLRDAVSSRLFTMTTLGAATGQVSALAAEGALALAAIAAVSWLGRDRLQLEPVRWLGAAGLAAVALDVAGLPVHWGLPAGLLALGLAAGLLAPHLAPEA